MAAAAGGRARRRRGAAARAADTPATEAYVHVPMPPGFRVVATELDGPVFADARGPDPLHLAVPGDARRQYRRSQGPVALHRDQDHGELRLHEPLSAGLELPGSGHAPELRADVAAGHAAAGAKPVGKWTIIKRQDGKQQWAYDDLPVYTSVLDTSPAMCWAAPAARTRATGRRCASRSARRRSCRPASGCHHRAGRLLQTARSFSVYASDADTPHKSNCNAECAQTWQPMLAPASVRPHGDWAIIERSPGVPAMGVPRQAAVPLCAGLARPQPRGQRRAGLAQRLHPARPAPPAEFTVQDTTAGQVLADAHGMTIYSYTCGDDALDQLGCDHPSDSQVYRLAMCGGGDWQRCLRTFPYVSRRLEPEARAAPGARSTSTPRPAGAPHRAKPMPCMSGRSGSARLRVRRRQPTRGCQRRRPRRIPRRTQRL